MSILVNGSLVDFTNDDDYSVNNNECHIAYLRAKEIKSDLEISGIDVITIDPADPFNTLAKFQTEVNYIEVLTNNRLKNNIKYKYYKEGVQYTEFKDRWRQNKLIETLKTLGEINQNIKSTLAPKIYAFEAQKVNQEIQNFSGNTEPLQDLYKVIKRLSVRHFNSEDLKNQYQGLLDSLSIKLEEVKEAEQEKQEKIDSKMNELLTWVNVFPKDYSDLQIGKIKDAIQGIRGIERKISPTKREWITWISRQNTGELSILPPDLTRKVLSYLNEDEQKQLRVVNRSFKLIHKNHSWQLWQSEFNYWEILSGEPLRSIFNFLSTAELKTLYCVSNLFKTLIIRTGNGPIKKPQRDYVTELVSAINTRNLKGVIFSFPPGEYRTAMGISNGRVYLGLRNGFIEIYDLHTKQLIGTIKTGEVVRHIKVVNGKLFSVSDDLSIQIWDVKTKQHLITLKKNDANERCFGFYLEILEDRLFLGLDSILGLKSDTEIQVWNLKENKLEHVFSTQGPLRDLRVKGPRLFAGSNDGSITIWNWETGDKIGASANHNLNGGWLNAIAVSGSDRLYSLEYHINLNGDRFKTITIWDANDLQQIDTVIFPIMRYKELRTCTSMECTEENLVFIESEGCHSRDLLSGQETFITVFNLPKRKIIASFKDSDISQLSSTKFENNILYLGAHSDRGTEIKKFDFSQK